MPGVPTSGIDFASRSSSTIERTSLAVGTFSIRRFFRDARRERPAARHVLLYHRPHKIVNPRGHSRSLLLIEDEVMSRSSEPSRRVRNGNISRERLIIEDSDRGAFYRCTSSRYRPQTSSLFTQLVASSGTNGCLS